MKQGLDIVLVRKSGPVRNLRFGSWFIGLIGLILLLLIAGLVAGGFLFYKQSRLLVDYGEQINLLMLRAERLEYLSQEQETRELLAEEALKAKAEAQAQKASAAEPTPTPSPQPPQEEDPTESEVIALSNISRQIEGGEMVVNYAITNKLDDGDRAEGYIMVVAHGQRRGKPWLESRPPMRLSALGRPINYRRATPFAIQRYRQLTARFSTADSKFDRLEFFIYSRRGQLLLTQTVLLDEDKQGQEAPEQATSAPQESSSEKRQPESGE
ncbi:hypothetical protein [Desulfarculus baarsii]|nr:hypothetical protein [Desulfarculus baarsii]